MLQEIEVQESCWLCKLVVAVEVEVVGGKKNGGRQRWKRSLNSLLSDGDGLNRIAIVGGCKAIEGSFLLLLKLRL